MFRDGQLSNPDGEKRQLGSFVRNVESHISAKERFAIENTRNRSYFEMMGGELLSQMDLPEGTLLLAKSVSPTSTYGFVQPVNLERGFYKRVFKEFKLTDILGTNPRYPEFWEKVADKGVVQSVYLGQDVFDTQKTDPVVTIGKGGEIILPEVHVEFLDDSNIQLLYSAPKSTFYLWPHCVAGDAFVFKEVPKELDRGFRVYSNSCETRRKKLFDDVSPPWHIIYKYPDLAEKRIAIEYNLERPNRMRPVEIALS